MTTIIWLVLGLALLGFLGYRAGRVWLDTGRRDLPPAQRLGWALAGAFAPDRYWWEARIEGMAVQEREELLSQETDALGLSRANSQRCPLCSTEVPRAWALNDAGRPTVAPGPVECPSCDFRLDACRHCTHFLPGSGQGGMPMGSRDMSSGRCRQYKVYRPVEETTTADMARRLKERGFAQVRAPMPIVDSFLPPDHCRAFTPERKRLKLGGVNWPDARRAALLRLLAPATHPPAKDPGHLPQDEDLWLL